MRVLDVGHRAGDAAARAARGEREATGVDAAAAMVAIARPATAGGEVRQAPPSRSCRSPTRRSTRPSGTSSSSTSASPSERRRELARVLALGGRVALSTWDATGAVAVLRRDPRSRRRRRGASSELRSRPDRRSSSSPTRRCFARSSRRGLRGRQRRAGDVRGAARLRERARRRAWPREPFAPAPCCGRRTTRSTSAAGVARGPARAVAPRGRLRDPSRP